MYSKIFNDPQLEHYFIDVNKERQKIKQKTYLAYALGAPIEWNGRSMVEAHTGLKIKEEEFNKFVAEIVVATLKEMQIQQDLIDEIIMTLLTIKNDIVGL